MSDFVAAVLRAVTWRAVVLTQGLGALYAVIPWLQQWGHPGTSAILVSDWTAQSLTGWFVMLAAFAGDEAVRRGWRVLSAFAVTLLCASLATAIAQSWVAALFNLADSLHGAERFADMFFRVGSYWGTVLLVYLNRQSAARLLARLRAGELARVQAERSLIASQLAATEAQIKPAVVLRRLAEVRDLYAARDDGADSKLEILITDLRDIVTQCAQLQTQMRTTEGTLDRPS
jgi:hypothetical protein